MTNQTLEIKALPAVRLAQVSAEVNDITEISAMIRSVFDELQARLEAAGVAVSGRGFHTYYGRPDGSKIDIAAGVPVEPDFVPVEGVELVALPAEATAAVVTHRGPASEIADAWQTLDVAIEERGFSPYGVCRQLNLKTPEDSEEWVVELQLPLRPISEDAQLPTRSFVLRHGAIACWPTRSSPGRLRDDGRCRGKSGLRLGA